ncbi:MAG: branched-chain amino acid ABC transporter permease, partial [Actinobacteria bacterium]|nr:branched-chain amino acid ABC transporter permease [Actinomycetota bacterium]
MKPSSKLTWVASAAVAAIFPLVVGSPYVLHVVILSLIYTILATSLNLVTGYSGLLSLGHQAFFGIGAYTSAILVVDLSVPFPLAMLAAGLASLAAAYFIGGITLRLRSAYFVIATIAFAEMLRLVSLNWYSLTRGPLGIANIPAPSIGPLAFNTPQKAYYLILILAVLAVATSYRIANSHIGRVLVGIKDAEHVARAVGVYPTRYLLLSVLLGGFMAGIAGSFYAHYMRFLSPDVLYFGISVNLIVMVMGGGIGTVFGPVIGAFAFTAIPEV